jgi:hypothetical protein
MAGWGDYFDFSMGTQPGIPLLKDQSQLGQGKSPTINAPAPVTATPVQTYKINPMTGEPFAGPTPSNNPLDASKNFASSDALAKGGFTSLAQGAAYALNRSQGTAKPDASPLDPVKHEATRLFVGVLGLVLIAIGGLMMVAGAVVRSPATPMLAAGALAGGLGTRKPNTGNAGKGRPKGATNKTFDLDIGGKTVPLKPKRAAKAKK